MKVTKMLGIDMDRVQPHRTMESKKDNLEQSAERGQAARATLNTLPPPQLRALLRVGGSGDRNEAKITTCYVLSE